MSRQRLSLLLCLLVVAPASADDAARAEHFEKKIRPILATHCFSCHGPTKQKGGLRLDRKETALAGGETGKAIVPGKNDDGELLKAVRYDGDGYRMPPTGKLPADKIADLERWVRDGAYWPNESIHSAKTGSAAGSNWLEARRDSHWCWQPVKNPPIPPVKNPDWAFGDVDRFLLAAMERENVKPTRDADPQTLFRRLRFLLTGLPPTRDEWRDFSNDKSDGAFERAVDRMLASPEFGERWGRHWLDLVRYSETLGHEFDFEIPNAWRYRDYVIRALNADLPYDRFVVEHVAGDLLSKPRLDAHRKCNESVVGTAFWWLGEAKQAPVDVRAEQADRVDNQIDVLGKTFLGLTVSCARCHDHKFDAIAAADYYSLYGFVKSTRYSQASTVPTSRWREEIAARSRLEQELRRVTAHDWKNRIRELPKSHPNIDATGILSFIEPAGNAITAQSDPEARVLGEATSGLAGWRRSGPAALLGDAQPGEPVTKDDATTPIARLHEAAAFDSSRWGRGLQGSLRSPTFRIDRPRLHVLAAGEGARFSVVVDNFNVIRPPIYGGLRAPLNDPQPKWRTIDVAAWIGREAYVEFLDQRAADFGDPDRQSYPPDGWFAVERVLLSENPPPALAKRGPSPKPGRSEFDAEKATPGKDAMDRLQRLALDAAEKFRTGSPMTALDARVINVLLKTGVLTSKTPVAQVQALIDSRRRLDANLPDYAPTPAAEDGDGADEAVFVRGNSKKLGQAAPRRFLAAIDGEERVVRDAGSGRLALANRIVDPKNPLVARVLVNRVWRHVFGRGLVESPDNFGALGEAPTHPELLDRLAVEFVRDGWSIKRLVRKLVTTRAFRLSSEAISSAVARDPQNRWFSRANVRRLEAEPLRDALLSVSGRRNAKMYGQGTLVHLDSFADGRGKPASGPLDGDGRRTVYLAVRRNFPSSLLSAFDAPIPAGPIGKRSVSNVPAQALILLNDPFVVQSAKRCAERLTVQFPTDREARLDDLYASAFGRDPSAAERKAGFLFLDQQKAARSAGDRELAAWADLCHAIFNAKEFLFLR